MNITTLGIDLAKTVFQLHGIDSQGKVVLKKKISRHQLPELIAKLPVCRIVMEACGGANYWARTFQSYGHEVQLISPQFVKPYVKGNKTDACDAEAIVEAASRPSMRYVSPKTQQQQDLQSLLRIRQGCIEMRTKMSNQLRGLLAEYGIVLKQGLSQLRKALASYYDRTVENVLSDYFKDLLESQHALLVRMDEQISDYDKQIKQRSNQEELCQRVQAIEGIGPITALALAASLGTGRDFKNGRHFSAYLGLVPKQHSSGGRERLLGISKRGDSYLRQLLIHGARAVLIRLGEKQDKKSEWLRRLKERLGMNRACVALANKNARTVMALLLKNEAYQVSKSVS